MNNGDQQKKANTGLLLCFVLSLVGVFLGGLALARSTGSSTLSVEHITLEASNGSLMMLTVEAGRPQILFYDAQNRVRLDLGVTETGVPQVSMYDSAGTAIASLDTMTKGGQPQFYLRGAGQGKIAWRVTVDEQGLPEITTRP